MPTGVTLRDPREQLFSAAERILLRAGPGGLTSRAVTAEAGVAKGVLHRHFADFDDFLVELVGHRGAGLRTQADRLLGIAGKGTIVRNLAQALADMFDPIVLGIVGLVTSRDELRHRLRRTTPFGVPLLTEVTGTIASYLRAERDIGRLRPSADTDALAFAVVGTAHLLFAGEIGGRPDITSVEEIVALILVGAERGLDG